MMFYSFLANLSEPTVKKKKVTQNVTRMVKLYLMLLNSPQVGVNGITYLFCAIRSLPLRTE